jgi:dipeptidase E
VIRLLLISSSRVRGGGWLDDFVAEIDAFLGPGIRRALFVPYAIADHDGYLRKVQERLAPVGVDVDSIHEADGGRASVARAQAVIVGGGNTFRLLATLQARGELDAIGERARDRMPFLGWSAGSNLACPTIRTTNDMPIVEPKGFGALGVVPFQINPHYVDADPGSTHMGETREQRIEEFLEENEVSVLGLREGAFLRREGPELRIGGVAGARLFGRGKTPEEIASPADLSRLLR